MAELKLFELRIFDFFLDLLYKIIIRIQNKGGQHNQLVVTNQTSILQFKQTAIIKKRKKGRCGTRNGRNIRKYSG
jgi:hypothetical protein